MSTNPIMRGIVKFIGNCAMAVEAVREDEQQQARRDARRGRDHRRKGQLEPDIQVHRTVLALHQADVGDTIVHYVDVWESGQSPDARIQATKLANSKVRLDFVIRVKGCALRMVSTREERFYCAATNDVFEAICKMEDNAFQIIRERPDERRD